MTSTLDNNTKQQAIVLVAICKDTLQELAWTKSIPSKGSLLVLHARNDLTRRALRKIDCPQSRDLLEATALFAIKEVTVFANNPSKTALSQLAERLGNLPEDRFRQVDCLSLCFALGLDCKDKCPEAVAVVDVTSAVLTAGDSYQSTPRVELVDH